jgi:hypothetical protein
MIGIERSVSSPGANSGNSANPTIQTLKLEDLVLKAATDSTLFNHAFFPKTFRQASPESHKVIDAMLDDPTIPFVNLRCFRGSSKTTKLRAFTAKRIAYAISHTILYIGASEPHAIRSIRWIKNQIERNKLYAGAFGLKPGKVWQEANIQIEHGIDERPIWLLGVGITGNIRGINFDDYRPDLIVLDDVITDENAATLEQRDKINKLILGAVMESLVPQTEEPNAKMAMLQTPLHPEDACALASKSSLWSTYTLSCWTKETEDLPLEQQESSWPERYPTEILRKKKLDALAENRYSVWARENECKLISSELATFRSTWLGRYTEPPVGSSNILVIDPVPPPSERQRMKGLRGKDFEAHVVVGRKGPDFYALDVRESRGHQPNWTVATALELARRWRVMRICLIAVGYETALENLLKVEMARRGVFHAIQILPLRQKEKIARITSNLAGPASQGHVWIGLGGAFASLAAQFEAYGPTYSGHDDALEAFAHGVGELTNPYLELSGEDYFDPIHGQDDFVFARGAP